MDMQFITADKFRHKTLKDSRGQPCVYKRNGQTKTWKMRPCAFKIPVKRGLREYGYITHENADKFEAVPL